MERRSADAPVVEGWRPLRGRPARHRAWYLLVVGVAAALLGCAAPARTAGEPPIRSCFEFLRPPYSSVEEAKRAFDACYPADSDAGELVRFFTRVDAPFLEQRTAKKLYLYHHHISTNADSGKLHLWDISVFVDEGRHIFRSLVTLNHRDEPVGPIEKIRREWIYTSQRKVARQSALASLHDYVTPARIDQVMTEAGAKKELILFTEHDGLLRIDYHWEDPSILGIIERLIPYPPGTFRLSYIWKFDRHGQFLELVVP